MELIPAIDLLDGLGVRLREGDFSGPLVEAGDPPALARRWAAEGATRLHVVDLAGARDGTTRATALLSAVVAAARRVSPRITVQAGGGLRNPQAIQAVMAAGADAAVIGTAALTQPGFLATCAERWPGRILAALDLRDGRPVANGWLQTHDGDPLSVAARLLDEGAAALLVTDTRRDGTLRGPNLGLLATFRAAFPEARMVAAGGIGSAEHLRALQELGVDGAIVGMALLTGAVTLPGALRS